MKINSFENRVESSNLSIDLKIDKSFVEELINNRLPETLFKTEKIGGKKLKVTAKKAGQIEVLLAANVLIYEVPLHLEIIKKLTIGDLTATGLINLKIESQYDIHSDWKFITETKVLDYEWVEVPRFNAGFMDFSIESIADLLIKKGSEELVGNIDSQIGKALNLNNVVTEFIEEYSSLLLSESNEVSLLLEVNNIKSMPIKEVNGKEIGIQIQMTADFTPKIFICNLDMVPEPNIQKTEFSWIDNFESNSKIQLPVFFSYDSLEKLAVQTAVGETFSSGNNQVLVEDLKIEKGLNFLRLRTRLSGSLSGEFTISAQPAFDRKKGQIVLEDLTFDLKSDSILMRGVSWMFKNALKNTIKKNIDEFLETADIRLLQTINDLIQKLPVPEGIDLKIDLDNLNFSDLEIHDQGILLIVETDAQLICKVDNLNVPTFTSLDK